MNEEILLCRQGWDGIERGFREKESMRTKGGCGMVFVLLLRRGVGRNGLVVWQFFWRDLRVVRKSGKKR